MTDPTDLIQRLREDLPKVNEPESQFSCVATPDIRQAADALEQQAAQIEALRGQHAVLVRLLVEADKVLGTIDGESQEEWDMLLQLRRCITAATMPHRPEDADLLSIRERLGC